MPRRVVSNFSKGMITDSISEEGAVAYLQDMYLRKKGELISRGPVYANAAETVATPVDAYTVGYGAAQFHPNFGLAVIRGIHDTWSNTSNVRTAQNYQLIGAGLQSISGNDTPQEGLSITWGLISEGADSAQCSVRHDGTMVSLEACYQSFNTGEEMIFLGENGYVYKWGGSFEGATSTGTVSISANGIITGSGTQSWSTTAEVGMYILIDGVAENGNSGNQRAFRITSVIDNTHLGIELALDADATARNYRIQRLACVQSPEDVWNADTEAPFTVGVGTYHNNKMYVAGVSDVNSYFNSVFDFDSIRASGDPDERGEGSSANFSHLDLWHVNHQFRVMPGVGGFIRGLVSMGTNLVVIKSHGLFAISGNATWNGNVSSSYDISVVSSTIGAAGFRAWFNSPAGLILANDQGMFLYQPGEGISSLTSGRIDLLWESFSHYAEDMVVNCFGSLVTVGSSQYPDLPCICWDMEKDYFWVGTNMSFQSVVTLYDSADQWIGHAAFAGHVMNMPQETVLGVTEPRVTEVPTSDLSSILHWNTDAAGTDLDASGVNVGPSPIVATHPIALSDEGPGDGRVNNIGVTLYSDRRTAVVLRPGESGVDQILYSEHQSDGTDFGVNASISRLESTRWGSFLWGEGNWGQSVVAGSSSHGGFVEEEIPLTSEVGDYSGGYKNVRVPVDSFPSSPFASIVFIISNNQLLDMTSYQVRLQALYIDYEQTNNFGTI